MSEYKFFWRSGQVDAEIDSMLSVLADEFPIREGNGGKELIFKRLATAGTLKVMESGKSVVIEYGNLNCAARGVGLALAGIDATDKTVFQSLGIMLDCSRNAVMTVPHFKKWLSRLALMGYNMAMLYTEDTYQLPDEPYFGYMRGPYTMTEMKEVDAFAAKLGIKMIACIQTLGHLEQILQWDAYREVRDTSSVLLVDAPKTYELIDKMVAFWTEAFSARRIHIGMDETHDLGRGKFMDKFGYERGFDIFNRHLAKVNAICDKYHTKPMIWSDMYFRMGNTDQAYYAKETVIPDDVKKKIPANVELVYWDYYNKDKAFYADWIQRHRDLGHESLMGSGVWTWSRFWYDRQITEATVRPCVEACTEMGLKEIFFTLWGDDGAYCEFDSCLAGLAWAADLSFGSDNAKRLEKSFQAITGGSYSNYVLASEVEMFSGGQTCNPSIVVWDDPMLGKWYKELEKDDGDLISSYIVNYQELARKMTEVRDDNAWADVNHAYLAVNMLLTKLRTMTALYDAYDRKDRDALLMLKSRMIPESVNALREYTMSSRKQWLRRNKPFGLETMQVRFGGLFARWEETALRLGEYLDGKVKDIPELEVKLTSDKPLAGGGHYRKWASGSTIV